MKCPGCRIRLHRGVSRGGFFWACVSCGGSLCSLPVLRRELPPNFATRIWQKKQGLTRGRNCPVCQAAMQESCEQDVIVDVCARCQFVWFDHLEFESLNRQRCPEPAWIPPATPVVIAPEPDDTARQRHMQQRIERYRERVTRLKKEVDDMRNQSRVSVPEGWEKFPYLLGVPVQWSSRLTSLPIVSYLLGFALFALGLIHLLDLETARELYAFRPGEPWRDFGLTMLTYLTVPAAVLRQAVCIYLLVIFGDDIEDALGRKWYVLMLLVAAGVAALAHQAGSLWNSVPLVGLEYITGAAIVGCVVLYPHARISTLLPMPFLSPYINVPAWGFAGIWFVLILPALVIFEGGSIFIPALLAGNAAGVAVLFLARMLRSLPGHRRIA